MYEDCKVLGPYRSAKKGKERRFVIIRFPDGRKKTTAYARYLLEVHLGRELRSDEDADHIDGDWLNDDLSNLRPLPSSINRGTRSSA